MQKHSRLETTNFSLLRIENEGKTGVFLIQFALEFRRSIENLVPLGSFVCPPAQIQKDAIAVGCSGLRWIARSKKNRRARFTAESPERAHSSRKPESSSLSISRVELNRSYLIDTLGQRFGIERLR